MKTGDRKELRISYDRNNVTVRLYDPEAFLLYKQEKKRKGLFQDADYLELPSGTVTPDGYYYNIRGKESLKAYLAGEEEMTVRIFIRLTERLEAVLEACRRYGVALKDVLFDYNAVFLESSDSDFRFIYMPGSGDAENTTTVPMLVNAVYLNMDWKALDNRDREALETAVDNLLSCGEEELGPCLAGIRGIAERYAEKQDFGARLRRFFSGRRKELFVTLQGEGMLEGYAWEKKLGENEPVVFRVGRDNTWSDVEVRNLLVSRRHAEIRVEPSGCAFVTDYSRNGTRVLGEPQGENGGYLLKNKQISVVVAEKCGVTVRLRKRSA